MKKPNAKKDAHDPSLHALRAQIDELTDALKRERADAENVRRRADEERAKLSGFYKVMVVQQFLPALDSLELALKHTPKELAGSDYVKGISSVAKQFERALLDAGVERIKTVGESFDPRLHEAISMEDQGGPNEVISEELQAGYTIGQDIIRHAMVRVVSTKS